MLGNPPYVRMERLKPVKPYLEKRYAVASDRADLYCYFYELGLALLKPGGRLGYISSSTFFKTGSGEPLRRHLLAQSQICTLVDFGDIQVFEGVTTYPAIVVLDRCAAPEPPKRRSASLPLAWTCRKSRRRASATRWTDATRTIWVPIRGDSKTRRLARLRGKLTHGHPTLKDTYGSPCRGVVTGLNEAFIAWNRATRDALIAADPKSAELLKPFLEGEGSEEVAHRAAGVCD